MWVCTCTILEDFVVTDIFSYFQPFLCLLPCPPLSQSIQATVTMPQTGGL